MRTRERRVAEAITAYLAQDGQEPDPRALVRVVGEAAGAAGCALVVGGRRFEWGEGGPWLENEIAYGGAPVGVLAVAPESVGPLPGVAAVLGAPVAVLSLVEDTDRLRRDGDTASRALVDDRWRAAAEMEQERRGLERDLHDGAQHRVSKMEMKE